MAFITKIDMVPAQPGAQAIDIRRKCLYPIVTWLVMWEDECFSLSFMYIGANGQPQTACFESALRDVRVFDPAKDALP